MVMVQWPSPPMPTPAGNIGPILDAVMDALDAPASILCPALPANGRTVKGGILYVGGVPLADSSMKDHPLTPMWASRITELMAPQSRYAAQELHADLLHDGPDAVQAAVSAFAAGKERCYFVPDYVTDADAALLAELFGDWTVLSGGSGILEALARKLHPGAAQPLPESGVEGKAVILAGSCSVATHAQTECLLQNGGLALRLEDDSLLTGAQTAQSVWAAARSLATDAPVIYAYDTPEGLKRKRNDAGRTLSGMIEKVLSEISLLSLADGITRIIVAGGETSGAVTKALGFSAFRIGESIAPGVPILIPLENPAIRLVLKSGNFGQQDFFLRALQRTKK